MPRALRFLYQNPQIAPLGIIAASALALAGALIGQYGFDLRPCELCVMQRIPFILNIALGLCAIIMINQRNIIIGLAGLSFAANSGIAAYHSGVERKWWQGLSGCSTPDMSGSIEDLLKRIAETNVVRCDEIPWSLFGLSMANYNVMYCSALAIACGTYLWRSTRH